MLPVIFDLWGCMTELSKNCSDMSNAASTYLGIIAGTIIGGVVSWWIYNRQKRTSDQQDKILGRIKDLEENHTEILKRLEELDSLQEIDKNLDSILDKIKDK